MMYIYIYHIYIYIYTITTPLDPPGGRKMYCTFLVVELPAF